MIGLTVQWTADQWSNLTLAMYRLVRHDRGVEDRLVAKANELHALVGDNFETGLQNRPGTTRARAWVRPANDEGVHDELADGVLLKAAAAMRGR